MRFGNSDQGSLDLPLIIAELSGNHNGSIDRMLRMVDEAATVGVDAIKIQTYTADTITLNISTEDFVIQDSNSPWFGRRLYELYQEAHTPWEWHEAIFNRAREVGVPCFSTPFDETAVEFLEQFNPPVYKISSFENTHYPLIKKLVDTGRPLLISTGLATKSELVELVGFLRKYSCEDFVLLKCTSAYPAHAADCNLQTMVDMQDSFNCEVGLSDHTLGVGISVAAAALGAVVIEKHFTLDRQDGGPDASFSLEPHEFRLLIDEVRRASHGIGKVKYGPTEAELPSMRFRRSIYVSEDVKKGEKFSTKNLAIVRPSYGLPPIEYSRVVGRRAQKDLKRGDRLNWSDVM
jgi:pseudaminic acid synthase